MINAVTVSETSSLSIYRSVAEHRKFIEPSWHCSNISGTRESNLLVELKL